MASSDYSGDYCGQGDDGLDRLAQTLGSAGATPASRIWTETASGHIEDDVTIISLRRP